MSRRTITLSSRSRGSVARGPRALVAGAVAAAVTLGALTGTTAQAEQAALPAGSPLQLWAPAAAVAYTYDGYLYEGVGLRLVAPTEAFELWSNRPSYDDPIHTEWRGSGGTVALPEGTMTDFTGLPDFLKLTIRRASDNSFVRKVTLSGCLNGESVRMRPDADARSPYPWGCPNNPYTLGSVMGIQAGWSTSFGADWRNPIKLKAGDYQVRAKINPVYASAFGISAEDAQRTFGLKVIAEGDVKAAAPANPRPAAHEPTAKSAGAVVGPVPDLRALPAFGIVLNRDGTALRFGANVWNGGESPLVVDGFRGADEDAMDAYQYFFDADGNQTGYQLVGQMHFHSGNHNHWHFEDFAQYRLLNADLTEAVKSTKQSFCLANTDAVDYTVPGADWRPDSTDLSTACGGREALSIREVLSSGSGDTYFQYRYGQAFRIRDLPNGVYYIAVEANPLGNLVESDTTNNTSLRKIRLGGKPGERRVTVFPVGIIDESQWGGFYRHR